MNNQEKTKENQRAKRKTNNYLNLKNFRILIQLKLVNIQ